MMQFTETRSSEPVKCLIGTETLYLNRGQRVRVRIDGEYIADHTVEKDSRVIFDLHIHQMEVEN
jgi:DNA-directed RNA polymerase subunit E'/Rpb7